MRISTFSVFLLLIFSLLAIAQGYLCVKKSFNDPSNDLKDKERAVQSSKDELIQAGLLKYAGVFGGPSDYAELDESGRSKRVKRYET
ncbi:uncharacterized protein isoform X2 [Rhodnius prolixus]